MRRASLVITVCVCLVLSGCGGDDTEAPETPAGDEQQDPGVGHPAQLNVAEADRIEIRQGGASWPTPGRPEAWDQADVIAEVTDPNQVRDLVESLSAARLIDVGAVDYDLAPPDYQVGFLRGSELLDRLGDYERISAWGEYDVPGRWVTGDWELLAVVAALPS